MRFKELVYLIKSDLYRYHGAFTWKVFLFEFVLGVGGKYSIWMRLCSFLHRNNYKWAYYPARFILRHYSFAYGIDISPKTIIGPGLYIGHYGGIVISSDAIIGKNCEISHDVTIGIHNRGRYRGVPEIGDNVYIGPGAKIFGKIVIGSNVAIGANSVINRDAPDSSVVVGAPGRIVSTQGSFGYIDRTDYGLLGE